MKINTLFDNKNYNINESYLTSAEANFKAYLLNNMSGNGATLYFKDQLYNIDSSKLNAATNKFVQSFSSISGEGYKVSVNGTEYAISSSKLETTTNNMHDFLNKISGDGEPVKNQYGFYYNVPYVTNVQSYVIAFVFYENGQCGQFSDATYRTYYPEDLRYSDINELSCIRMAPYVYDEENRSASGEVGVGVFSEDGLSFNADGMTFVADLTVVPHAAYYGKHYYCAVENDVQSMVFNEDGTITYYENNGDVAQITKITWNNEYSGLIGELINFVFSLDGKIMYNYAESTNSMVVYAMKKESDLAGCNIQFGKPYVCKTQDDGLAFELRTVCYEDGSGRVETYIDGVAGEVQEYAIGTFVYTGNEILLGTEVFGTVNEDGTQITSTDGMIFILESESDILDNEFPIEFNSFDVVNNTPFSIEEVQLARVSDNIVTDEELLSFVVTANMSGMTIPLSCGGMDNEGDYSLAVYKTPDESMSAFIVSVNTPFEHNGSVVKTGLYVTNCALPLYNSMNLDITIEKVVS